MAQHPHVIQTSCKTLPSPPTTSYQGVQKVLGSHAHIPGARAAGLALLRAVDPVEADTFSMAVVQNFDGVAVEDGDDLAGEVGGKGECIPSKTADE